ncbi:hypothetical protein ABFT23_21980 [Nocardioides sp. C4-1]|uniref:hypothetical protein n=1 Tax=Nocardioides sp. C4-1 TaxID=3151851 RepID=UPI003263E5B6
MTGTGTLAAGRRVLTVVGATAAVLAGSTLLARPASAAVPQGWPATDQVSAGFILGVMIGGPVLLFAVIALLVYLPGMIRGERVGPGANTPEDQWLGGRRSAGEIELGTADGDAPAEGGASARW